MKKKPIEQTAEYLKFLLAKNYVNNNKKLFKPGNEFLVSDFTDAFGIVHPNIKGTEDEVVSAVLTYNRKRTEWQNRVNRILAQRGLYVSLRVGKMYVKSKPETIEKVESFYVDAERKNARGDELAHGIIKYGSKYSPKVTDKEVKAIVLNLKGNPSGGNPDSWKGDIT